ncbi:MAG TPA: hypothetical protein P5294_01905 [Smithellaceae bacterium]|nr:hypothetical protein [Smithellaceae bacterium]HRS88512.1 hypothetical protein [Smithellaceae bacterium]HRV25266.1 hypothetical protein [Smithellaceae bacterium]
MKMGLAVAAFAYVVFMSPFSFFAEEKISVAATANFTSANIAAGNKPS